MSLEKKAREAGSRWGKKLDDTLGLNGGVLLLKRKRKEQRSGQQSALRKRTEERRMRHGRRLCTMEEELTNLADMSNRQAEYWAWEYEGQFYVSNARMGVLNQVYQKMSGQLNTLGLLVDDEIRGKY